MIRFRSIRQRMLVLLAVVTVGMAGMDIVAVDISLVRSLQTYSAQRKKDQAGDWAQVIALLYAEHQSWRWFSDHTQRISSIHIDGRGLQDINAVIKIGPNRVVYSSHNRFITSPFETAPISLHHHKVATLYIQGYSSPKISILKNRMAWYNDVYQIIVFSITVLFIILCTMFIAKRALRPLEKLAEAAKSIIGGNYGAELPIDSDLEVANVVRAFLVVRAELRRNQTAREKIVADVHHELRTPLTVISNRLEAVQYGIYALDEKTTQVLRSETERMKRILAQIEQLNEPRIEEIELHRNSVHVQVWLSNLVPLLQAEAQVYNIEIVSALPKEPLIAWFDEDRIAQVIWNLITNAIRFSKWGSQIYIKVENDRQQTVWQVRDEGNGIATEHLPYIFDRFYRVDASRNRKTGGSGLGLAIVREVIEAHEGKVTAVSKVHQGTTIIFTLPKPKNEHDVNAPVPLQ